MKEFTYEVSINNATAFTTTGDWQAIKLVREFVTNSMTASFSLAVTTKTKTLVSTGESYPTWRGGIEEIIKDRMFDLLWQSTQSPKHLHEASAGDKGKSTFTISGIGLSWACTSNRRTKRPKAVIEADKARRAAKSQARKQRDKEYEDAAVQRTINLRNRIKQQVDHAFALGKSGTEPAAKYITCQHCDAPAAVVCLNQPLARGA